MPYVLAQKYPQISLAAGLRLVMVSSFHVLGLYVN